MKLLARLIEVNLSSTFNEVFPPFLTKSDPGQYSIKVLDKHLASSTGPWLPWGAIMPYGLSPWKPTKNHEKPCNYLKKPWKLTKNHEKTMKLP